MKKILLPALILLGILKLEAQQSPRFINYLFNESAFNPALAGVNGTEAFLFHRQEWTGLNDGNFSSQILGGSIKPFGTFQKIGIGALLMLDQAHIIQSGQYGLTFSYQILDGTLTPHRLSLGLLGGVTIKRIDFQKAQINNPFDVFLFDEAVNETGYNFGMGIAYSGPVGNGKLFLNAASTQSNFDFNIEDPDGDFILGLKRNILASARYRLPINQDVAIEPAVLFRTLLTSNELKEDFVFGIRGHYKQAAWAGLMYATASNSVGLVVGINLGKASASGAFEMPVGSSNDLGLTYELGIHYQPGEKERKKLRITEASKDSTAAPIKVAEGKPEKQKKDKASGKSNKKDKTKALAKKEDKKEEEGEETLISLKELISKYNLSKANALKSRIEINPLVGTDDDMNAISYRYTDLYAGYNNTPPVDALMNHLKENIQDWQNRGFEVVSITATTNSSESQQIMSRVLSQSYEGEFGAISGVNFQFDGQNTNVVITPGEKLTIREVEYLKLYRLANAFQEYTGKIDLRLNANRPIFETVIEIIIK